MQPRSVSVLYATSLENLSISSQTTDHAFTSSPRNYIAKVIASGETEERRNAAGAAFTSSPVERGALVEQENYVIAAFGAEGEARYEKEPA